MYKSRLKSPVNGVGWGGVWGRGVMPVINFKLIRNLGIGKDFLMKKLICSLNMLFTMKRLGGLNNSLPGCQI